MLLAALALGVIGAVGTTYNYNRDLENALMAAFKSLDFSTLQAQYDTVT
jgi:dihydrodipicolinate synthase/N-acetylneuraminate lyase